MRVSKHVTYIQLLVLHILYHIKTWNTTVNKGRNGHVSIGKGNSIVHIGGGSTDMRLEAWRLQEDEFTFKVYESRVVMDFWSYYPNVFIVGENDYLE